VCSCFLVALMATPGGSTSTAGAVQRKQDYASAVSSPSSGAHRYKGPRIVFWDSACKPAAVYGADRERLAHTSIFFAGLFEPDAGNLSNRPTAFAVCAAGREQRGMRRLPLPVPSAYHYLVPYLDSGSLTLLRALGTRFNALGCDDACAVFANACFLGVSEAAEDVILTDVLAQLWPTLASSDRMCPDFVSAGALEKLLRLLAVRGWASKLQAARTVLMWAHRGGWGAPQSAQLQLVLDKVAPLSDWSSEDICTLTQTAPREMLDVALAALPAEALRKHLTAMAVMLANANRRNQALLPVRR
jgi:hypothetical protein